MDQVGLCNDDDDDDAAAAAAADKGLALCFFLSAHIM